MRKTSKPLYQAQMIDHNFPEIHESSEAVDHNQGEYETDKLLVVVLSDAQVQPNAVVVEADDTLVADQTVLCAHLLVQITVLALNLDRRGPKGALVSLQEGRLGGDLGGI